MSRSGRSTAATFALVIAALLAPNAGRSEARAVGEGGAVPATIAPPCGSLSIEPSSLRIATGDVADLRAIASSDDVHFTVAGESRGATFESAGRHAVLRAGGVARFDVVARAGACPAEARAHVEIVPPITFNPSVVRVARRGTAHLRAADGAGAATYRMLSPADGATLTKDGTFAAPDHDGRWRLAATDGADAREVAVVVEVGRLERLRAAPPVTALAEGASARVAWTGGSNLVDISVAPPAAARLDRDASGQTWVALAPGAREARVTVADRATGEHAVTRLVAATPLLSPLAPPRAGIARSTLASGDFNGDGRPDLVVGHAQRDRGGLTAGGLLVFYGHPDGALGSQPDLTIEGDGPGDALGSVLLVADFNGDGIDDLVAGVPQADLAGANRGVVAIRLGSRAGLAVDPVVTLAGEEADAHFGTAIAARDLDGDGSLDLVVSAQRAHAVAVPSCFVGRAYVYRGTPGSAAILDAVPADTIDVADALASGPPDAPVCPPRAEGSAVALADLDADGLADLAFGASELAYPGGVDHGGAIEVYRGAGRGQFEHTPAWSVHLSAGRSTGLGLGAVLASVSTAGADALLAGEGWRDHGTALFLFDRRSFPAAPKRASGVPRAGVVVPLDAAVASYTSPSARNLGWAAAFTDVDGDARPDLVALDVVGNEARVDAFHLSDGASQTPFASAHVGDADFRAAGLALLHASDGARGLAVLAVSRGDGPPGALGLKLASGAPDGLVAKLGGARAVATLPTFPADQRDGAQVALSRLARGSDVRALVEAGGFEQTDATPSRADAFALDGPGRPIFVDASSLETRDRDGGFVPVDFDGDGAPDLAVVARADALPRAQREDPARCLADRDDVGGGTVVRVFSAVGDAIVERARIVPRRDPDESPLFAASVAAADVDGDHKEDLVLARDAPEAFAVGVVHGRAFVPGKVLVACSVAADPAAARATGEPAKLMLNAPRLACLGDVDRDGCEDVAYAASPGGTAYRVLFVSFGHDPTGQRCRGHRDALTLAVVPSVYSLRSGASSGHLLNVASDPRGRDLVALAPSAGDVTGDGVPDLVFADRDLRDADGHGPAVEIVSGAWLGALCPSHACAATAESATTRVGDWTVAALPTAPTDRWVVRGPDGASDFGARLAVGDVDGDGVADVAASSLDDRGPARFTGAVFVYRGARGGRPFEPMLAAYGGAEEDSRFGASIALGRDARGEALLLVGAPNASRGGAGHEIGASFLVRAEAGELR